MQDSKYTNRDKKNDNIGLWPSKTGNGFTVFINDEILAQLQAATVGARLGLYQVKEPSEKGAHFHLVIHPSITQKGGL